MSLKVCYFAWVRQKTGIGEEMLPLPEGVKTVRELARFLASRDTGFGEAFSDLSRLRAAVNQNHVGYEASIGDGDEIAFFPPVTGG